MKRRIRTAGFLVASLACAACGSEELPLPTDSGALAPDVAAAVRGARESGERGDLGLVYEANGLPALAAECYRPLANGRDFEWRYRLAVATARAGDLEAAVPLARRALEARVDVHVAHARLGGWLFELGRLDEAEAAFGRALELAPSSPAALAGLARVHLAADRPREALASLERARGSGRVDHLVGTALLRLGRADEARPFLARGGRAPSVDDEDPFEARVRAHRAGDGGLAEARALAAEGRSGEAIESLEALLARRPGDGAVLNNLALALSRAGRHAEAVERLEQALEREPDAFGTRLNRAIVALGAREPDAALEWLDAALEIDPGVGRAHELRGIVLRARGERDEALAAFERARSLDARNPELELWIGRLQLDLGRWGAARASFAAAAERRPDDASAHLGVATAALELGALDEAGEALTRAAAIVGPDEGEVAELRARLARARRH